MATRVGLSRRSAVAPTADGELTTRGQAADAATLAGYLPYLTGYGDLQDYYLYGDKFSSIPRALASSNYGTSRQTVICLLGQIPANSVIRGWQTCTTSAVTAMVTVYPYWGTSVTSMAQQTSLALNISATAGPQSATYSTPLSLGAGYLGVVMVSTLSTLNLAASPVHASGTAMVNPTATISGYITGSTTPASTTTWAQYPSASLTSQKVWVAALA